MIPKKPIDVTWTDEQWQAIYEDGKNTYKYCVKMVNRVEFHQLKIRWLVICQLELLRCYGLSPVVW